MLKSMTGYGRGEVATGERKIAVELKAVNHKYCDISVKMPRKLARFEAAVRGVLKEYVSRGKVDALVSYEEYGEAADIVRYNRSVARGYMRCLEEMAEEFHLENDVTVSCLARFPDVLVLEEGEADEKELWEALERAVREAAGRFVESRAREGDGLGRDILQKLDGMERRVGEVERRSPEIVREYREKLAEKVRELLGDAKMEESVLASEVILFADKACVDEETVRLRCHMRSMREAIASGEGVGRKLDFIAQEMNREANTILSKANDVEVSACAIELKTEIEKVREQIQNIE